MKKYVLIIIAMLSICLLVVNIYSAEKTDKANLIKEISQTKKYKVENVSLKTLESEPKEVRFNSDIVQVNSGLVTPKAIVNENKIEFLNSDGKVINQISVKDEKGESKTHAFLSEDSSKIFVLSNTESGGHKYKLFNNNGSLISSKESRGYPTISNDGSHILVTGSESIPIESFIVYNADGNELWRRGYSDNIYVFDARILNNGDVVSIEKKENGNVKIVLLDKNGEPKWEYSGIEPRSADYSILIKNNVLTIAPNTYPTTIYTLNLANGNLLWKRADSQCFIEAMSDDGKFLLCKTEKGISLVNNLTGKEEWEKEGLKGEISISPSGRFITVSNLSKDENDNIYLLDEDGNVIWTARSTNGTPVKLKFQTDSQFYYIDGKTIVIQRVDQNK